MAYPIVSAPYGYRPVNLIGGQVYAGSTRNMPIQYNSATPIYFGDFVTLTAGYATLTTYPMNSTNTTVGVFLGCFYTNPTTKQRQFAQYYPGSITAGDITAIVADDPDVVIQTAVATTATSGIIGSASSLLVGFNMVGTTTTGYTSTGNGTGGVVGASAAAATTAGFRVLSLVSDTQISNSAVCTAGASSSATSVTVAGLPLGLFVPIGTDLFNLVSGQLQFIGTVASPAVTVASTTAQAFTVTALGAAIPAAGTVAFVQTPEVLVKINFGTHRYNLA